MHILFLSDNFPPEVNAPASRTFEHCREWAKAGHDVTVITCAPNFPKGKVFDGYRNQLYSREQMDGVNVIRVWTYITRNEGFAKRILDYLSFMVSATAAAFFVRRVDVIVGTSPQFFTACAAYATAALKRKPWVFELRDIWPESIRAVGAMRQSRLLDALEKLELFLYRRASAIVSVTHAFKENLISRGIDAEKVHVVTNGVDTSLFLPQPKDEALEIELHLQEKFIAGYIGTHGMAHGLNTILDAARLLQDHPEGHDIRILMLGDGAYKTTLQKRAQTEKLSNIIFIDSVPKDQVVRYWSLLDASIVHLKKNDLFKTVIPSKIFECMGMGLPVLHGVEGESAQIVTDENIGIVFEPENAQDLIGALLSLKSNEALQQHFHKSGPIAAKKYDRRHLAERMLQILRMVASK